MLKSETSQNILKFSIKYQTIPGQDIYILGSINELGKWKEDKFKLKWHEGHKWKGTLALNKNIKYFEYKFVCISNRKDFTRWERCPNRIFLIKNAENDIYKINCVWEHILLTFHIYYPLKNENEFIQIMGRLKELGNWFANGNEPKQMSLSEPKTLGGIIIIINHNS